MSNITDRLGGARSSLAIKAPVRCATTANITLSGFQTIDGEVLAATDGNLRVLVKAQTDARENGIYVASSGLWQRSRDFDGNLDIMKGTRVYVTDGVVNGSRAWVVSSEDPLTIGTSNIEFIQPTDESSTPSVASMDEDTANDDMADFIPEYDTSAGDYRKVKVANLGFTQSGTHGVLRKMKSKIADHRDILDYLSESQAASAIAGTLDMTQYLQWMLDELPSSKGVITFKRAGNYLFQRQAGNAFGVTIGSNRSIVFDRGVRLKTEGLATGVNSFSGALFRNNTMGGSGNENISIEGGEFQVNAASSVYGGGAFFGFKNVAGLRLIGQRCLDTVGSCRMQLAYCRDFFIGEYAAHYTGEVTLTLQSNQSVSVYEYGDALRLGSGCHDGVVQGVRLDSGDDAIALNNEPSETDGSTTGANIYNINITDAVVTTQRGHGFRIYNEATMVSGNIYNINVNGLTGDIAHAATNAGISVADYANSGAGRNSIYDLTFSNVNLDVSDVVGDGVLLLNTDKVRVVNSRFAGCDIYGINCNKASRTWIINTSLFGAVGSSDGVLFANGSHQSQVSGGMISSFGRDNVHIESNDCRVSDLYLVSPGRGNIIMVGATGTQIGSCRHVSSTAHPVVQESSASDYTVCQWQDVRGCAQGVDTASKGANSIYLSVSSGGLALSSGIAIAGGGTGATTATGARANLAVAPSAATYIVQTANSELSAEQALSSLATGLVKNTTGTGVLSIAAAGTDYYGPGSTDVAVADGGTGSSTASGARTNLGLVIGTDVQAYSSNLASWAGIAPATKLDASAVGTIASQNANSVTITGGSISGITDLAVADGGTGASSFTAYALLCGNGTSALQPVASLGTAGQVLTSNGAGALPSFQNSSGGGGGAPVNRLINGCMRVNQRGLTTVSDDSYCFDRWYALTQTSTITIGQQTNIQNGWPYAIRLTQSQASAQRMGLAQIIESADSIDLRGQSITLSALVRMSASTTLRYAILEWTGTADVVTSDWVLSWTSTTFTAGNFFTSTSTTVAGTGSTALTANTATAVSLTASISSSANNVAVMFWTDSAQAQNVTLDLGEVQVEPGSSASTFALRDISAERQKCDRFYQNYGGDSIYEFFTAGMANSNNTAYFPMNLRNIMRTSPAIGYSALADLTVGFQGGGAATVSAVSIGQASRSKPYVVVNLSGTPLTAGDAVVFQANNTINARIGFDSEL